MADGRALSASRIRPRLAGRPRHADPGHRRQPPVTDERLLDAKTPVEGVRVTTWRGFRPHETRGLLPEKHEEGESGRKDHDLRGERRSGLRAEDRATPLECGMTAHAPSAVLENGR